jgi:hypothetical protein
MYNPYPPYPAIISSYLIRLKRVLLHFAGLCHEESASQVPVCLDRDPHCEVGRQVAPFLLGHHLNHGDDLSVGWSRDANVQATGANSRNYLFKMISFINLHFEKTTRCLYCAFGCLIKCQFCY